MSNLFDTLHEGMAKRGHDVKFPGAMTAVKRAADMYAHLHHARTTALGNPDLNPAGQRRQIQNYLTVAAPAYVKERRMLDAARATIDARRAAVKPKFDKADPAILCAVAARVAAMPRGDQEQLLALVDSSGKARDVDPVVAQAVLTLPPILSGVHDDTRARFETAVIERQHGPVVAAIDDEREAWSNAEAALKIVEKALYEAGGFASAHQYTEWLKASAPPPSPAELAAEAREVEKFAAESMLLAAKNMSFETKSKIRADLLTQLTEDTLGISAAA